MDFEEIYNLYFREVFLYIRSLSGDENIAEEVTQLSHITKKAKRALDMIHLFGGFFFIFHYDRFIPYEESLVKIEIQDDGMLVSHYYGVEYYTISATHPQT